jgi:predicted O-methyltransferase YrrM
MNEIARNRILAGTSHVLEDPQIELLLERMYYDAQVRADIAKQQWDPRDPYSEELSGDFGYSLRPAQGEFIYIMARAMNARLAVCVPVSGGAPVLYLGAAIRDNCGGRVVGVEPREKYRRLAREAVAEAGLDDFVQIYGGDPATELAGVPGLVDVDIALVDGWPDLSAPSRARSVLDVLAPRIRQHGMLVNDNREPDYVARLIELGYDSLPTDLGLISVRR